ncbi:MAG TPA: PfkB family carbohydrate kinase [Thermomicrobiales bacterium]|nr:PfkB family carbohydrate kinase [Thermomicrobiales bacterium]
MNGRSGVIVVGSVHTDLIATADAMPTPGSSVLGTRFTLAPGGKAGNQAAQLARLGVPTVLISRIGTDSLGDVIAAQLAGTGIDLTYLARSTLDPTGASTVFAVSGEYASIIVPGAAAGLTDADLDAAESAFRASRFALAQLELGPDLAHAALSRARTSGSTTVLNASPIHGADPDVLAQVLDVTDVLVVNRHEAAILFHAPMTDRQAIAAAASMLNDRFDLKATIITCGSEGAVLVRGDAVIELPAWPIDVVDTVGAGDAFLGGLVAAWYGGSDDRAALRFAAAAGALAASGSGAFTSLPNRPAVEAFLQSCG